MPLANADSFRIPLCDESVHTIVTSTPYFGLRVYDGIRPTVFGGRLNCEHEWAVSYHDPQPHGDDGMSGNLMGGRTTQAQTRWMTVEAGECRKCGAWRGHFGGELLHDCLAWARGEPPCGKCFICHFRELAREMWRVLRDDGTCWVIIGDSFAGGGRGSGSAFCKQRTSIGSLIGPMPNIPGLKSKDKMMIPERVRLALQADGWYVRSVAPWIKKSSMPESVTDRPANTTEDIILLAKSRNYFFDMEAVRKTQTASSMARQERGVSDHHKSINGAPGQTPHSMNQPRQNTRRGGGDFSRAYAEHQPEHGSMDLRRNKQDGLGKRTYTGFNARWKDSHNLSQTFARPNGKNTTLTMPGQAAPSHRADRDDVVAPGRNRRNSDWFFESLGGMISEAEADLCYMRSVRDKGGLMADENGNPLAFLVNPRGYKGAHYATFPTDLVTPMILASTSARGVCPKCGAPWERVIEKGLTAHDGKTNSLYPPGMAANRLATLRQAARERGSEYVNEQRTIGWRPTCAHYDDFYRTIFIRTRNARKRYQQDAQGAWFQRARRLPGGDDWPIKPARVLDPFVGSGTTVLAAKDLGRTGIGLDVSLKYLRENALPRAERTNTPAAMSELPLFAMLEATEVEAQ